MTNKQSTYRRRWIYTVVGLLLLGLSTAVTSYLLSYFKTGAEQNNIYELGYNLLSTHHPEITWNEDDPNIGGEINKFLREEITKSYSDAWGILNLSMAQSRDLGLRENFTEVKTNNLQNSLTNSSSIIRNDLSHQLQLHFISLDKQVVSFSDQEMISEIYLPQTHLTYNDTSAYSVVMTLSEGKWRINKLLRKVD